MGSFKDKMLNRKPLNNRKMVSIQEECEQWDRKLSRLEMIGRAAVLLFLAVAGFFGCSQVQAASDPALEAGLVPHKALYDIKLSSKKSGVMVSNLSGKMVYEWHPSCDGWLSNYQFDMLYEYIEMPAARITSDVSTFESFDGKSFNFNVQRKNNGNPFEEYRGTTKLGEDGSPNSVVYSMPKDLKQDLPKGTFFPIAHTLYVLEEIREGKRLFDAPLFDGSGDDGPSNVNTFIGKEYMYKMPEDNKNSKEGDIDSSFVNTKAWDLRLAFFPLDSSDIMPEYEMTVVFHENGVISKMEIDYADFSISQDLLAIEPVETSCDTPVSKGEDKK